MITTRTPLRITLGGGGSDLEAGQGICLAATIDKYVTVTVSESWDDDYVLHYSETERVDTVDEIRHRIIREVFRALEVQPGIHVSSVADVPAGTGLGNSGAFAVGLIKALRPDWSRHRIAELACQVDIGQQDQWSAVWGGCNVYDFAAGTVRPVLTDLESHFALYFTGMKHDAAEVLTGPAKRRDVAGRQVAAMVKALEANDPDRVGELFTKQWVAKLDAAETPTHIKIDHWIGYGVPGAHGAKLVGAGDGGFVLCVVEDRPVLWEYMTELGLDGLAFRFTHEGARCV